MRIRVGTALVAALAALAIAPAAFAGGDLAGEIDRYGGVEVLGAAAGGSHQAFTAAVRPRIWFPKLSGDVRLDSGAVAGTTLDVDDDFGLGDSETDFGGEVDLRFGSADLWLAGFAFSRSGKNTVTRSFVFGDITVTGSADVETDFDLTSIGARFGYALFGNEETGFRFGPTIGVNWVTVKIDMTARSTLGTQTEKVDESAPVPALGLRLEVPISDFLLTADAQGLALTMSDFRGTFLDLSASFGWRPMENVGIFVGYRYVSVDAKGKTSGDDWRVDLRIAGPFAEIEFRF